MNRFFRCHVCESNYVFAIYLLSFEGIRYENTDDNFSNLNENKPGAHSSARSGVNKAYMDLPPDVDIDEKIHQENPYGDMYANEQYCPDILIKDIGSVIMKKRMAEDDGFKREYAVSLEICL